MTGVTAAGPPGGGRTAGLPGGGDAAAGGLLGGDAAVSGLTGGGDAAAGGLLGLTWDHPRGYAPLLRLARLDEAGTHRYGPAVGALRWERQSLEGFEAEPIALLAQRYDLLVVDHPGLGAAVESGCLVAMDELFGADELAGWRARTVGPSFDSYTLDGRTWALPLDAATQVAVARPDLLAGDSRRPGRRSPAWRVRRRWRSASADRTPS